MTHALETLASIQVSTGAPEAQRPEPTNVKLTTLGAALIRIATLEATVARLEKRLDNHWKRISDLEQQTEGEL